VGEAGTCEGEDPYPHKRKRACLLRRGVSVEVFEILQRRLVLKWPVENEFLNFVKPLLKFNFSRFFLKLRHVIIIFKDTKTA